MLRPKSQSATPRRAVLISAAVMVLGGTGVGAWAAAQPGLVPTATAIQPRPAEVAPAAPITQTITAGENDTTPAPPPEMDLPALGDREVPHVSAFTPEVVANIRSIVARDPELRNDVFAKMGGSSIVSRAYLHCFAGDNIDLAGREGLQTTIEHFRRRRMHGRSSFTRDSEAAGVGWSLRQGTSGRPSKVERELRAIHPRYALAFFGGNDVQGRNERVYARRLIGLIEDLVRQGVVPVLGAIQPRRDREMHPWVRRYNRITWAVAEAWHLPYVDFHDSTVGLANMGLAGDGVHPNVYRRRGRTGRPCDFTDRGLSAGFNVRNLLTLQVLDQLRRTVSEGEEASVPSPAPLHGDGSVEAPREVTTVPFATRITPTMAMLDGYQGCEAAGAPGPERVFRVRVDEPTVVRATVVPRGPDIEASIYHLGAEVDVRQCRGGGTDHGVFQLDPGVHHFAIEVHLGGASAEDVDTGILFALTREQR